MKTLPVIFRKHYDKHARRWEVTAFFPTLPADSSDWYNLTCYSHVGQHGSASPIYFRAGRLAKYGEYADLLAELRQIYENDQDEPLQLKVCMREHAEYRRAREREWRRYRAA